MKRFLLACLGMALLGAAGLLILHQVIESPPAATAQPPGGGPGVPPGFPRAGGAPMAPPEPGQYKDIVPPLVDALADTDGGVRQLAAATLVKIGPDAMQPLIEALKAKDRETRANAAYVLGLSQSGREALPDLARVLKDEDKEVRRRAAYAIHSIVSRNEAAALAAARPNEGVGPLDLGLAAQVPQGMRGGTGSPMPGGPLASPDPGLLLPPLNMPGKPEKEQKKE